MKKDQLVRYDLDKVYFMNEYNQAVSYGNQNINIPGVKEQLHSLENEKSSYFSAVANVTNPERENERTKYQQYEKWAIAEKKCKQVELALILFTIIYMAIDKYLPIGFRNSLIFSLLNILLIFLVVLAGPISFIVAKIIKNGYSMRYRQYIDPIQNRLNDMGSKFARTSIDYYTAIDNLYLLSLEPTHRELVLLRRQQEQHNQDMLRLEKNRQKAEAKRLKEQQMTRQATEELLEIEKERERRYRGW